MKKLIPYYRRKPVFYDILILAGLVLLLTVPFINQAFHIDDRDFIEFAKLSAEDPSKFELEENTYRGILLKKLRAPHPPVLTTYLGLILRTGAQVSEPLFHAAYLVFPLVAAISMYSLARRFTRYPLITALLLVVTPGFLVMSHTIMGNLPGLSLALAASAMFIWGADKKDWKLLAASSVMMAVTVMTAYQALSIIPVLFVYALINHRRQFYAYISLILPIVIYGLWRFYMEHRSGVPPAISYQVGIDTGWKDAALRIRAIMIFIGGAVIFPVSVWLLFLRKKVDLLVGIIALPQLVIWGAVYYVVNGDLTLFQGFVLTLMLGAGFLIAYKFIATGIAALKARGRPRDRYDSLFLSAWFFIGLMSYLIFNVQYVSVRHLLILFPPIILFFMRDAGELWQKSARWRSIFILTTLLITLIMGLAAAITDYNFANSYRSVAEEIGDTHADSDRKVWVRGEFGFRYYLEQQGFEILSNKSEVKDGDIIIFSDFGASVIVTPWPEGEYSIVSTTEPGDDFPVRIMNRSGRAGFYGHAMGPLPITISRDKLDEIVIYQIDKTGT